MNLWNVSKKIQRLKWNYTKLLGSLIDYTTMHQQQSDFRQKYKHSWKYKGLKHKHVGNAHQWINKFYKGKGFLQ